MTQDKMFKRKLNSVINIINFNFPWIKNLYEVLLRKPFFNRLCPL